MVAAYGLLAAAQKIGRTTFCAIALWAGLGAAPLKLLTFGDSLTAGYGLTRADGFEAQLSQALHRAGYDVVILDGGVSGDTSAGGRARIDWSLADKPDAALVELGGNDGLRGLDSAEMDRNLTAILDRLDAAHVAVLLSGMYPPPNLGADYTSQFRAVFDRLGARPGLIYDPFFLQGVALHPQLIQADGIHPNPDGVRLVVARLLPLVERLLDQVRTK